MQPPALLKTLLSVLFLAAILVGSAQSFTNIRAEYLDGQMRITYDLLHEDPSQAFSVELRTSVDDFGSAIRNATGDIGDNIKPGNRHSVYWNPAANLPEDFDGQLQFKLLGTPMDGAATSTSSMTFKNPVVGGKVRRAKTALLEWAGTSVVKKYNLELLRFDSKLQDITIVDGGNTFSWDVPADLEVGEGYELRLVSANNSRDSAKSGKFQVQRKIPLLLKIVPVVAAGGVIAAMAGGGGDPPGGGTTDSLPRPPDP